MNAAAASRQYAGTETKTPSRLLVVCILASLLLHLTLLLVLPGWWRITRPEVPAVLDVVLMPADTPALTSPPEHKPLFKPATPLPVTRTAPAAPARAEIAVAQSAAEPALPAIVDTSRTPAAATPALVAAPRAEPAVTPPAFNAAYLRNPPPRYPPAARRNGEEGTVLLRVLVTVDGAAARVELDRSSGSALLDSAAQDAVRGWRFVPARRGTQNAEDWVRVPVVFRLES